MHGIASVLLFAQVMVAYMLKSIPVSRCLHSALFSSSDVDAEGLWPHVRASSCSVVILFLGFLVANAVPFFDAFLGLVGAMLSAPIAFAFPVILYVAAVSADRRRSAEVAAIGAAASSVRSAQSSTAECGASPWYTLHSKVHLCVMVSSICFIAMVMVVGTYAQVKSIVEQTAAMGPPFSCHAYSPKPI